MRVTYCVGGVDKPEQTSHRLVSCVAPMYGSLNTDHLQRWCLYHAALGVDHFYLYTTLTDPPILERVHSYTWIDASWQNFHKKTYSKGLLWSMHDCLYRTRSQSDAWAMFTDLDEWVNAPHLAREIDSYQRIGKDAIMLPQSHSSWDERDGAVCELAFEEWLREKRRARVNHASGHKYVVDAQRVDRVNNHIPTGALSVVGSKEHNMSLMHDRCLRMHFGTYSFMD